MAHFFATPRDDLEGRLPVPPPQARELATRLFDSVYRRHVDRWDAVPRLPEATRRWLEEELPLSPLEIVTSTQSSDDSRKVLFRLEDGETVEAVLIPRKLQRHRPLQTFRHTVERLRRVAPQQIARELRPVALVDRARRRLGAPREAGMTACLSTQVGCGMRCDFCLTGEQGLTRNLRPEEIVGQVVELRKAAQVDSVVFMGMGEPLQNTKNVIEACRILQDRHGFDYGSKQIIVSTCGLAPEMDRLSREVDVHLSLSLNATTDELRREIMPIGQKWDIAAVLDACRRYAARGRGPVLVAYVLLHGVNDSDEDARRLAKLVRGMDIFVSLIPHNEYPGSRYKKPPRTRIERFREIVENAGIVVSVREPGGEDISAACGQLKSAEAERPITLGVAPR